MTEDKARLKWCPMVRLDSGDYGTFNRMYEKLVKWFGKGESAGAYHINSCNCIASDCAMWVPCHGSPTKYGDCGLKRM